MAYINAMEIDFVKMHGIGNDIVVIDSRKQPLELAPDEACLIADRRIGIGCDQIMVITDSVQADIGLTIYNNDGSMSGACGNGTRCVADLILDEKNDSLSIEIEGTVKKAWREDGLIAVDMGRPLFGWQEIPLAEDVDTLGIDLGIEELPPAIVVNIGNPHAVHLVDDAERIELEIIGPILENHALFPERVNVEVVSILPDGRLRMRVWERGAGITRACGSGAAAVVAALIRKGVISDNKAEVVLDGGSLFIEWIRQEQQEGGHIIMRGASTHVFKGQFTLARSGA